MTKYYNSIMKHSWGTFDEKMEKVHCGNEEEILRRDFEKVVPSKSSTKRGKRFRSAFTTEQVNYLETEFRKYPYIGNARRKDVATILNIPERAVKIWFQNRRMKEKKDGTNKEVDEIKNPELGGDQLRSLSVITSNKIYLSPESNTGKDIQNNIRINEPKLDLSVPRCVEINNNFYKDISPARETKNHITSGDTKNDTPMCKKSAEFSIELLKKYKTELPKEDRHKGLQLNQGVRRLPDRELKTETFPPFPVPPTPQDLSSYKKPTVNYDRKVTPEPSPTNSESPLYFKGFYAQSYAPPGNMMWKPLNIAPVMSTGFSPLNLSNNTPVNMTGGPQDTLKRCNCDCHLKPYCSPVMYQQSNPAPQVQYVITAIPLQSSMPKF